MFYTVLIYNRYHTYRLFFNMVTLIVYTVAGSRPVRDGDYYFAFFVSLFSGVMEGGDNNESHEGNLH